MYLGVFLLNCRCLLFLLKVKVKVKSTTIKALRLCTGRTAHKGCRGIALLFLGYGTRRGGGASVTPCRSLPPGKTRYPLYRRLGGPQGQSGKVRNISPPPGFDPHIVQPVASRYTDYATRPTISPKGGCKLIGHFPCSCNLDNVFTVTCY